jgi:hypothetical protein
VRCGGFPFRAGLEPLGGVGRMAMTREEAVRRARVDLAARLGVNEDEVTEDSVEDADFPDAAFGAGSPGELAAQMITPGWRIRLSARGERAEYRANRNRMRLYNFRGENHQV